MSARGEDGEIVQTETVEVEVSVRAWDQNGTTLYDWIGDHDTSNELFKTIDDALRTARQSLGGY